MNLNVFDGVLVSNKDTKSVFRNNDFNDRYLMSLDLGLKKGFCWSSAKPHMLCEAKEGFRDIEKYGELTKNLKTFSTQMARKLNCMALSVISQD